MSLSEQEASKGKRHGAEHGDGAADLGLVNLSGRAFVLGCGVAAILILMLGRFVTIPSWVLAVEVFLTIIGLFVFGSIRYRLHKNALTYGAALLILATFYSAWWPSARSEAFRARLAEEGGVVWWETFRHYLLSFHGLDELVHIDTMLFILGLTFFVSVIAQTRLLETITFVLLRRNRGSVLPTVLAVVGVVSFASGILDGVSMIGLTIRTLVIILALAAAPKEAVRYAVVVCTVVTTVCGMWLAYGEPPNLIMKANVHGPDGATLLNDAFFVRFCAPAAILSFLCVAVSLVRRLRGLRVDLEKMDVVDANIATVRFLQASQHGAVFTQFGFIEAHVAELGDDYERVLERVRKGEPIGAAMVREEVPADVRQRLLGKFVSEELAAKLDRHYVLEVNGLSPGIDEGEAAVQSAMDALQHRRLAAQKVGAIALIPFIGLLVGHALNHKLPLFLASTAGFVVALFGIWSLPRMRRLALHDARHEYSEYYFLFPLFLSITLLSRIGFFDQLSVLLEQGIVRMGAAAVAMAQFLGATFLSAILDNNVVADFASRAIVHLGHAAETVPLLFLFSMSQIAGYATGGCWTHIGSAQSVVAYAFVQREVDKRFTPIDWIRAMTPLILSILIVLSIWIILQSMLLPG